ncbi:MAG: hypothetical protein FRX48_06502 [Lasallia pustulata]|uniref:Uncharacterized protein n=1 Tax=Lasallia pustulata TaxID=136370 RepID=A0A5M8PKA5_9LECA|nr:MAG: hypothetical protein FRX48_06502 [Lasallia pustulata]
MNPAVELLIHISAPSRGSDDAKYRKQALGFLGFEAATRHSILPRDGRPKERAYSDGGRSRTGDAATLGQPSEHSQREVTDGDEQETHPYLRAVITPHSPSRTGVPDVPASPPPPATPTCPSPTISTSSPPTASSPPQSSPPLILPIPQTPLHSLRATAPPASPTPTPPNPPSHAVRHLEAAPSEVPDSQPPQHSPNPHPPQPSNPHRAHPRQPLALARVPPPPNAAAQTPPLPDPRPAFPRRHPRTQQPRALPPTSTPPPAAQPHLRAVDPPLLPAQAPSPLS